MMHGFVRKLKDFGLKSTFNKIYNYFNALKYGVLKTER